MADEQQVQDAQDAAVAAATAEAAVVENAQAPEAAAPDVSSDVVNDIEEINGTDAGFNAADANVNPAAPEPAAPEPAAPVGEPDTGAPEDDSAQDNGDGNGEIEIEEIDGTDPAFGAADANVNPPVPDDPIIEVPSEPVPDEEAPKPEPEPEQPEVPDNPDETSEPKPETEDPTTTTTTTVDESNSYDVHVRFDNDRKTEPPTNSNPTVNVETEIKQNSQEASNDTEEKSRNEETAPKEHNDPAPSSNGGGGSSSATVSSSSSESSYEVETSSNWSATNVAAQSSCVSAKGIGCQLYNLKGAFDGAVNRGIDGVQQTLIDNGITDKNLHRSVNAWQRQREDVDGVGDYKPEDWFQRCEDGKERLGEVRTASYSQGGVAQAGETITHERGELSVSGGGEQPAPALAPGGGEVTATQKEEDSKSHDELKSNDLKVNTTVNVTPGGNQPQPSNGRDSYEFRIAGSSSKSTTTVTTENPPAKPQDQGESEKPAEVPQPTEEQPQPTPPQHEMEEPPVNNPVVPESPENPVDENDNDPDKVDTGKQQDGESAGMGEKGTIDEIVPDGGTSEPNQGGGLAGLANGEGTTKDAAGGVKTDSQQAPQGQPGQAPGQAALAQQQDQDRELA